MTDKQQPPTAAVSERPRKQKEKDYLLRYGWMYTGPPPHRWIDPINKGVHSRAEALRTQQQRKPIREYGKGKGETSKDSAAHSPSGVSACPRCGQPPSRELVTASCVRFRCCRCPSVPVCDGETFEEVTQQWNDPGWRWDDRLAQARVHPDDARVEEIRKRNDKRKKFRNAGDALLVAEGGKIAFTAYNQAIEDAKAAIRSERVDDPYAAPTFINAIARKCSPHVYVNRIATTPTATDCDCAYADGYTDGFRHGRQSGQATETCERCAGSGFETDGITSCDQCVGWGLVAAAAEPNTALPTDLIAFRWAESLSVPEQEALLGGSLRKLQDMINNAATPIEGHPTESSERRCCGECGHDNINEGGVCVELVVGPDPSAGMIPCFCKCVFPSTGADKGDPPWVDADGHTWERRSGVECVECPDCCFTFAAVHGDSTGGYSCPNCNKGEMTSPTTAAVAAARDDGCLCQRCGMPYKVDIRVSDELWEQIRGDKNLLCGPCIAVALENFSDFDYYDLQHGSVNEIRTTEATLPAHDLDWALREIADGWISNNEREGEYGFYQNARRVLESVIADAGDAGEVARLQGEVGRLASWQADVEEREAACCPEDVPFDGYIRSLEGKLANSREKAIGECVEKVQEMYDIAASPAEMISALESLQKEHKNG